MMEGMPQLYRCPIALLAGLVLGVAFPSAPRPLVAQAVSRTSLSREEKNAVIERIIDELSSVYVYKEAAEKIAVHLRQQFETGNYDVIAEDEAFAKRLTTELRGVGDDQHLEVVVRRPDPPSAPLADPNALTDELRFRNFDFARLASLPGNVRYLELNSFPPPEMAGETAVAAMRFLAGGDAIIIDLRRNSGGTGDMVAFLSTYFFEQRTTLTRTFRRVENQTTEDRTLPFVPGPRILKADLFVLTSKATFSAAEAFAFALQQLERATIVGEVTRGGANAGRYRAATDRFRVFVPNAHATSAATGKTWDKVGIEPDVKVPASSALDVAQREALSRLVQKSIDQTRRRDLEWMAEVVRAKIEPSKHGGKDPRQLTGRYGPYSISAEGQELFYARDANPRWPLMRISPDTFVRDAFAYMSRVTFRGNGANRDIVVEHSDGRKEEFQREGDSH